MTVLAYCVDGKKRALSTLGDSRDSLEFDHSDHVFCQRRDAVGPLVLVLVLGGVADPRGGDGGGGRGTVGSSERRDVSAPGRGIAGSSDPDSSRSSSEHWLGSLMVGGLTTAVVSSSGRGEDVAD